MNLALFVHFRHAIIAATIRKKQAKQLEALASPRPTILIHGKANRKIRFVEPVLLLSARRAVPHSRPGALRGFVFGTDGSVLLTPRIDAFVATCYVFSPIASRLMGRTPGTHVLALLVCS